MKIIGLDSSGLVASVALLEDDKLIAEYTTQFKKTHSQTLLPMLDEVIRRVDFRLDEVDLISVAAGPGSFTGLRIGSATAKGLALALDKPIAAVPTVDALALNVWGARGIVCPILDARRNQVYTGLYHMENGLEKLSAPLAVSVEELVEKLNALGEKVTFLGDGVPVYKEILEEKLSVPCAFAPAGLNRQRAALVALAGREMAKRGEVESGMEHAPMYLRKTQAEREREAREKHA